MYNSILMSPIKSKYSVLNMFSLQIKKAFEDHGFSVETFDLNSRTIENIDFLFDFNGVLLEHIKNKFDEVKNFHFMVDPPYLLLGRLRMANQQSVYSFIDSEDSDILAENMHYNTNSVFIPHGGTQINNKIINFENKSIDILFSGSFISPLERSREYFELYPEEDNEAGHNNQKYLTKLFMDNYDITFAKTIDELMVQNGIERKTASYTYFLCKYGGIAEYYRILYRYEAIKTLLKAGYKVTCCGDGWEKSEFIDEPNFIYLGQKNYTEVLELIRNSKIVLNVSPLYKNGSHERIFDSMLNGAVCLSTKTSIFPKDLIDKETLIYYDLNNTDEMFDKINSVLDNKKSHDMMVASAKEISEKNHTWANRASEILKFTL